MVLSKMTFTVAQCDNGYCWHWTALTGSLWLAQYCLCALHSFHNIRQTEWSTVMQFLVSKLQRAPNLDCRT